MATGGRDGRVGGHRVRADCCRDARPTARCAWQQGEEEDDDEDEDADEGGALGGLGGLNVVGNHPVFGPLVDLGGQIVPLMMLMQESHLGAAGGSGGDRDSDDDDEEEDEEEAEQEEEEEDEEEEDEDADEDEDGAQSSGVDVD